jgi:hypothetical protein
MKVPQRETRREALEIGASGKKEKMVLKFGQLGVAHFIRPRKLTLCSDVAQVTREVIV